MRERVRVRILCLNINHAVQVVFALCVLSAYVPRIFPIVVSSTSSSALHVGRNSEWLVTVEYTARQGSCTDLYGVAKNLNLK